MRLQTRGMREKPKEYVMLLRKTKQKKYSQENDVGKLQTHFYVCLQTY